MQRARKRVRSDRGASGVHGIIADAFRALARDTSTQSAPPAPRTLPTAPDAEGVHPEASGSKRVHDIPTVQDPLNQPAVLQGPQTG